MVLWPVIALGFTLWMVDIQADPVPLFTTSPSVMRCRRLRVQRTPDAGDGDVLGDLSPEQLDAMASPQARGRGGGSERSSRDRGAELVSMAVEGGAGGGCIRPGG